VKYLPSFSEVLDTSLARLALDLAVARRLRLMRLLAKVSDNNSAWPRSDVRPGGELHIPKFLVAHMSCDH